MQRKRKNEDGEGRRSVANKAAETVAAIRYWHRMRVFHMEQRKRSNLSLGAFLRIALGWSRSLPADESAAVKAKAQALIANGEAEAKGKPFTSDDTYQEWRDTILASIASRGPHDAVEARATKEMERLAASLPVWAAFGEGVRGFGARSLAVIIGEAGDLSAYPKKGHLWKRMGLAVIDGVRQGGLKKSASAEDWIEHGYNRQRRSRMFVIGDCLVKSGDRYRQVYLRRKDYERVKAETAGLTVAPAAKIPAKRKAEFVADGVIHRRAQRYMEKMLLRDLWAAWRRASFTLPERATPDMPAADNSEAKANARVPIMASADLSSPRSPQQEMCA